MSGLKGHIFVVSYGRSGSTLVQAILNAMPRVCVRGENYLLIKYLHNAWRDLNEAQAKFGGEFGKMDQPWHGIDEVSPDAFAQGMAIAFEQSVLRPRPDTEWLGFKEIRYHECGDARPGDLIDFMDRFFANARFAYVVRRPEDVARSSWFRERPTDEVVAQISGLNALFRSLRADMPDRSCVVDFDRLKDDASEAASLFSLLGRDYDESLTRSVLDKRLTH